MNLTARNILQSCGLPRLIADWLIAGMDEAQQSEIAALNAGDADHLRQVRAHIAAELRRRADAFDPPAE